MNKAKGVALAMDADNMPIEKISQYVIESVLSIQKWIDESKA